MKNNTSPIIEKIVGKKSDPPWVFIEIKGGVAWRIRKPRGIVLTIRDIDAKHQVVYREDEELAE